MSVAPLKLSRHRLSFRTCKSFHAQMSVAPLKRVGFHLPNLRSLGFHAQMSVAPLKLTAQPLLLELHEFPRSDERGSIEAKTIRESRPTSRCFHAQMSLAPLKREAADEGAERAAGFHAQMSV